MSSMTLLKTGSAESMLDVWRTGDYRTSEPLCPFISDEKADEWDSRLADYYGNAPRRISCEWAMQAVLHLPMMHAFTLNAPQPSSEQRIADANVRLLHYPESENTLFSGSWQIGENTWVSDPYRLLLDCLFYSCTGRSGEYVLQAVAKCASDAEPIINIAESTGMHDALRRLASVVSLVPCKVRKQWHEDIQDYAKDIEGDIIPIWKQAPIASSTHEFEIDETFGVVWNWVTKQETRKYLEQ